MDDIIIKTDTEKDEAITDKRKLAFGVRFLLISLLCMLVIGRLISILRVWGIGGTTATSILNLFYYVAILWGFLQIKESSPKSKRFKKAFYSVVIFFVASVIAVIVSFAQIKKTGILISYFNFISLVRATAIILGFIWLLKGLIDNCDSTMEKEAKKLKACKIMTYIYFPFSIFFAVMAISFLDRIGAIGSILAFLILCYLFYFAFILISIISFLKAFSKN